MQRNAIKYLIDWKNKSDRMPLIIQGARQVGKTWIMEEFGKLEFKNVIYINFDENEELQTVFAKNLSPQRIIEELEAVFKQKISAENTLLIFDEIQECNRALTSLKYFCEQAPQYHIIAAGSLLGVAMHKDASFPVGKVDILNLYPLSFAEFLEAAGETRFSGIIEKQNYSLLSAIKDDLFRYLKHYFFVGGMPKSVLAYIENKDFDEVRRIQERILDTYRLDFSKHINAASIPKVAMIWDIIPSELSLEHKKFLYKDMKPGARASQFEDAMQWLENTGLIYKIHNVSNPMLPLRAYQSGAFKFFIVDIGLMSAQVDLTVDNLIEPNTQVFSHFNGALTEQFVLQELEALEDKPKIFYWTNEKGKAEIDFLIQDKGLIIPIEVKAALNVKAKSLKYFIETYEPPIAVRSSLLDYSRNNNLFEIPLYLISKFRKVVNLKNQSN
ncbi:MAG: AAA family ATPase [Endomicrobium sp.]|jgi:predicted AAA+ superfamily ATPase|nr:AAA family ATPase [Endomicrobium sp.]